MRLEFYKGQRVHGESNVSNTAQWQNKAKDLMFMLGLSEAMDQLAMASSVRWYGHVLMREDCHIFRRALNVEVVCQGKKGRLKRIWKM